MLVEALAPQALVELPPAAGAACSRTFAHESSSQTTVATALAAAAPALRPRAITAGMQDLSRWLVIEAPPGAFIDGDYQEMLDPELDFEEGMMRTWAHTDNRTPLPQSICTKQRSLCV